MIRSARRLRAAFCLLAFPAVFVALGLVEARPAAARTLQCAPNQQIQVRDIHYRVDGSGVIADVPNNDVLAMIQAGCSFPGGGSASPGGVSGDLQTNSGGAFGALTPGVGVSSFLATPIAGIPATWLQVGAAVANLGFTPPPNTRAVNTSGLLTGGGNLSADRTITMGAIAANTLLGNPTGASAAPVIIPLGANLSFSGGALVAVGGGGGGSSTVTAMA